MKNSTRCSTEKLKTRLKNAEQELKFLKMQDGITNLTNKKGFITDLTHLLHHRPDAQYAIIFLELNQFNNIYGRLTESTQTQLLRKITEKIQSILSKCDRLAQQERDKFLICLAQVPSKKTLIKKLKNIITSFQHAFNVNQQSICLTTNLGVSLYPNDAPSPEKLVKLAYQACRASKKMGENHYQFYDISNSHHTHYFEHIEEQLHFALQKNELSLLFQPQFDTQSGHIVGIEALLRWKNAKLGVIPPVDFIPIAEKQGLIFPITDWVVREACRQFKNMPKAAHSIRMSVNLSAREFQSDSPTIVNRLKTILQEEKILPQQLDLELTETNVMKNYKTATPIMETLANVGFHISCDDFGIGYSSLSHLKHLPLHTLKIDKSFIDNITQNLYDHAIVQAILLIAEILNFRVIAEGIEHLSQMKTLKALGCHLIQGYYLSRPVAMDQVIKKIMKH